jgi:hypothetical protein
MIHGPGAGFAEGALERADECHTVGRQGGAALFALGPEFERHVNPYNMQ